MKNLKTQSRQHRNKFYNLIREQQRRKAKGNLLDFICYVKPDYQVNWHHKFIADRLDKFLKSDTQKRLILSVPPQHGKSEIASRCLPAYVLGLNPNTKIAACSYSIDLARLFNRAVQRVMDTKSYSSVFPDTKLNSKRVTSDSRGAYIRNTEEFEVVGKTGGYKAVGTMGGLSGRTVDLAIIDDPVKDAMEANSTTYRERTWEWYVNVLETRLHNNSKVVIIMTRWHEDDLAGRLIERQGHKWIVINIPAIAEGEIIEGDPRKPGQPLWPERHNLQKLLDIKGLSEVTFSALYQGRPAPAEGNLFKRDWFEFCQLHEAPKGIVWDMWIDGAYTKKTSNDPTGIWIAGYSKANKKMYVRYAEDAFLEMPELLKRIPTLADAHQIGRKSRIRIEPKASGKSLRQMINAQTNLTAVEIKTHLVSEGKEARAAVASPKYEASKIVFIKANWNDKVINQLCTFPNATHDEFVDLSGYSVDEYFKGKKGGIRSGHHHAA